MKCDLFKRLYETVPVVISLHSEDVRYRWKLFGFYWWKIDTSTLIHPLESKYDYSMQKFQPKLFKSNGVSELIKYSSKIVVDKDFTCNMTLYCNSDLVCDSILLSSRTTGQLQSKTFRELFESYNIILIPNRTFQFEPSSPYSSQRIRAIFLASNYKCLMNNLDLYSQNDNQESP